MKKNNYKLSYIPPVSIIVWVEAESVILAGSGDHEAGLVEQPIGDVEDE